MRYVAAVDSGGTFSDCVVIDQEGRITTAKAPSTPSDYSVGVMGSIAAAAEQLGMSAEELLANSLLFAHGTTVATNALLERRGCKTGLLTTRGHEDALLIGRTFQKVAGLSEDEVMNIARLRKPEPIVPRHLIEGLNERMDAQGQVVAPLSRDEILRAAGRLVDEGVEAIAVCLLHSYANPAHELMVKQVLQERYPNLFVTISNDLSPLMKEYERTATSVFNAYLSRRTETYLENLEQRVQGMGLAGRAVVMQSAGGVLSIPRAKEKAVLLLTSGPAGGVIGARALGQVLGYPNIITTDVGGTSFDVGLIVEGEPLYAESPVFDQHQLLIPVIDIATVGTGGGSMAWLDHGILRMGPRSAGAVPGPACYGQGGSEATITDANVVLGRVNPDYFLGGKRKLDFALALGVIREKVADPLGISAFEAAAGMLAIADAHMADLVRKVTIERGYDPRHFVMFAFGGGGPVHAGAYGRGAGCKSCVVPLFASAFSAFGIAGSDMLVVEETSDPMYPPFRSDHVTRIFAGLTDRARTELAENGAPAESTRFVRFMTLRYKGQVHEIRTPVPDGPIDAALLEQVVASFEQLYEGKYGSGSAYRRAGIQALGFRVHGMATLRPPKLAQVEQGGPDASGALKGNRPVWFDQGFVPTRIYNAAKLHCGNAIEGPAVVEAVDTTIVIHPGQSARVDEYGNLVMAL